MHRTLFLFACILVWSDCFTQLTAPGGQYPFVHYTPKDGLVNSRVRKAYQDSKGKMYFLTYGGLSMFDGSRFRNYTVQNGLLSDLVNDILEVGDDSLLVAVNTCGLNVLVRGEMKELSITRNACPFVNQFLKSNDGNIYTTTDDGLYRLNKNSFEKLPALLPDQKDSAIYLGAITEYKDFLVFVTNDLRSYQGLYLYNKKTNKITDVNHELFIYGLTADPSGVIWLSTVRTVMILDTLDLAGGKLKLRVPYTSNMNPSKLVVGNINFNRQGELVMFSTKEGINRYRQNGSRLHISSPEPSTTVAQDLFIDRENVIWICHDGNGVYKLSNTNLQTVSTHIAGNNSGINLVRSIGPDSSWMIMNNQQWVLQTGANNRKFNITPAFDARSLYADKTWLYAVDYHNLYITRHPKQNETTLHFKKILTIPDTALFGNYLTIDHYGNSILFETRNIYVIRDGQKIFAYPTNPVDLIEGMYVDKKNRLWVTSRFGGLTIFSLHAKDPAHYIKKEFQFIKEFETASPRCMTVDENELLWVGTRHNGLMGFKIKDNQLKKQYHFQTHNGLTDNFITTLACDKNNNVIIGTQTGLDRLIKSGDNYRPENLTKSNNIFAYINYVWTDSGDNAFAWTNADAIFRMDAIQPVSNLPAPHLLIEEIKVNGKIISNPVLPLRLNYLQRNISFSVAAPTFIDEKQVKYSYLLSGNGNNEWSDTTGRADIPLLNLSPGNYSLRVKAFFPSTSYAPREIEFPFSIRPPWWQKGWFRLGVILLFAGIIYYMIRAYFLRILERKKNQFEKEQALEKERTRIAIDMHDDLGAGLSKIRFLSETVQRNIREEEHQPHLQNIASSSVELVDKFNEIIWAMNEKNNSLEDLLYYIRNYTAKYCAENNLAYKIEIPEQIPTLIISGEVRRHIFLTVKESLHNVVKHAAAKNVWLNVELNDAINITIRDDGKGFEFSEMKTAGNGLRNMEQRISNVNGKLMIKNENGTVLKVSVPLPGKMDKT